MSRCSARRRPSHKRAHLHLHPLRLVRMKRPPSPPQPPGARRMPHLPSLAPGSRLRPCLGVEPTLLVSRTCRRFCATPSVRIPRTSPTWSIAASEGGGGPHTALEVSPQGRGSGSLQEGYATEAVGPGCAVERAAPRQRTGGGSICMEADQPPDEVLQVVLLGTPARASANQSTVA